MNVFQVLAAVNSLYHENDNYVDVIGELGNGMSFVGWFILPFVAGSVLNFWLLVVIWLLSLAVIF